MKNTISKISLLFVIGILFFSCSKDDKDVRPTRFEYEYTTDTPIPDDGIPINITINVDANRTVIDPTKVFMEITLQHPLASDLSFGYLMPNDDNDFRTMVSNLGGANAYNAENTLSFNPNNTEIINPSNDFSYPNNIIPEGDYKEGTSNPNYPVETPLFNSMINKNINGVWNFFFLDDTDQVFQTGGRVVKIKLIFAEGALNAE